MDIISKGIIAGILWCIIAFPLTGMFISQCSIQNIWFQIFVFFMVVSPVWLCGLWLYSKVELNQANKLVLPLAFAVSFCFSVAFLFKYDAPYPSLLPIIVFTAFTFISYLSSNRDESEVSRIPEEWIKKFIPCLWLILAIGWASYISRQQHNKRMQEELMRDIYQNTKPTFHNTPPYSYNFKEK